MLSEPPLITTPVFSGRAGSSSIPSENHKTPSVLQSAVEIVTIESRTYEICDRSTADRYVVVAAERHMRDDRSTYTTDVAFYLIGKDDPGLQNREVEKGYPASLEELLSKTMEKIRKPV